MMNACFTVAALLVQDVMMREVRWRDLLHLALISPVELFAYRPWLTLARIKGMIDYFRGMKGWDKFERNVRPPAVAGP
jgi:hypothetical protein